MVVLKHELEGWWGFFELVITHDSCFFPLYFSLGEQGRGFKVDIIFPTHGCLVGFFGSVAECHMCQILGTPQVCILFLFVKAVGQHSKWSVLRDVIDCVMCTFWITQCAGVQRGLSYG